MRITSHLRLFSGFVGLLGLLFSTGCAMDEQSAPPLAGPSGYGLNVTMTASPDVLPRDGSSKSVIQLRARNADGKPAAGQRFLVGTSAGTLTETDVVVDSNGQATFGFTAPAVTVNATSASIQVVPVGTNADNTSQRFPVSIALVGPAFPTATFTFTPAAPGQFQQVSFDASASTLNGSPCSSCSYTWDFGDGTIGNGRLTSHRFEQQGMFAVTLTVTTDTGTTATVMKIVTIGTAQALTVDIKYSPTAPVVGDVIFNGLDSKTPDGVAIVDYQWDFGNGMTASGATAVATFDKALTYLVRLTVTDAVGRTGTTTKEVAIAAPAAPPAP
jgi:PKD repeat protein